MLQYIGIFFLIFTSLVGIFELVSMITAYLFDDDDYSKKVISVLPLSGHNEQLEYILRQVLIKSKTEVIVIDRGLAKEDIEIIENLKKEYAKLKVICI